MSAACVVSREIGPNLGWIRERCARELRRSPWLRDHMAEDDLVQEAALRCHLALLRVDLEAHTPETLRRFLRGAIRHLIVDLVRAHRRADGGDPRRASPRAIERPGGLPAPEPCAAAAAELEQLVVAAHELEVLSEREREVVRAYATGEYLADIAARIDRSVSQTARIYKRALLRMEGARIAARRRSSSRGSSALKRGHCTV